MDVGEHEPVWSPDGRYVAYVTWKPRTCLQVRVQTVFSVENSNREAAAPRELRSKEASFHMRRFGLGLAGLGIGLAIIGSWLLGTIVPALAAVAAGIFVIYRHSSNIRKLRSGTENVFRFGSPKP